MSFCIALLLFAPTAVPNAAQTTEPVSAEQGLTGAEVDAQVKEHFLKVDTNRDGKVDRSEADAAYKTAVAAAQAATFQRLDTNRDGMLSESEFTSAARGVPRDGWFDANDIDRNGRVELNEALARGQRNFDRIDANSDGSISEEEMQSLRLRGRRR